MSKELSDEMARIRGILAAKGKVMGVREIAKEILELRAGARSEEEMKAIIFKFMADLRSESMPSSWSISDSLIPLTQHPAFLFKARPDHARLFPHRNWGPWS